MKRNQWHETFIIQFLEKILENNGWVITHDPLRIFQEEEKDPVEIDLGAEKIIAAEKEGKRIAVEIKSFINPSLIYDFHQAVGQYINYRIAMELEQENRDLYLAVTAETYQKFQQKKLIRNSLAKNNIKLIVFDELYKGIEKWIE